MRRGRTFLELRYDQPPDTLAAWSGDAVKKLLTLVWSSCDRYCTEGLAGIDPTLADEQLERDMTQDIALRLGDLVSHIEPFRVQHERAELMSPLRKLRRPPQCDIGFVWRADDRIMWPVEAKVLRSATIVSDYLREIRDNYLTCRKAPLSPGGAMLGFLLSGSPGDAFDNISAGLNCSLQAEPSFSNRNHRTSDHERNAESCKGSPREFRCHHLLLEIRASA